MKKKNNSIKFNKIYKSKSEKTVSDKTKEIASNLTLYPKFSLQHLQTKSKFLFESLL